MMVPFRYNYTLQLQLQTTDSFFFSTALNVKNHLAYMLQSPVFKHHILVSRLALVLKKFLLCLLTIHCILGYMQVHIPTFFTLSS